MGLTGERVIEAITVLAPLLDHEAGGLPELRAWCRGLQEDSRFRVAPLGSLADLARRPDFLYVYFPEWMIRRNGDAENVRSRAAMVLAMLRLARWRGTKVVWHANNVLPHEVDRHAATDRYMYEFAKLADIVIASTQSSMDEFVARYPVLRRQEQWIIPMGHYRDLHASVPTSRGVARATFGLPDDARVGLSLGMIRRYKNHIALCEAFMQVPGEDLRLVVAGAAPDEGLRSRLRAFAVADPRIVLIDRYLADGEVLDLVSASDFLVLAATHSAKSGTAMLSLSFDRPILVPRRSEFIDWADQLGTTWVRTYDGGIRAAVVRDGFEMEPPIGPLDIEEHFSWDRAWSMLRSCLADNVTKAS